MSLGWITPFITTSRWDVQQCRRFGMSFLMICHTWLSIPALSISSYVFTFNSLIVCEGFFIYYLQTMQRVSNSWHSTMGSTAIVVVLAFCNEISDLKDSDTNCQEFATEYLEHLHFLYGKSDGDNVNVSTITILTNHSFSLNFIEIQGCFPWPVHFANICFSSQLG